MKQKRISFDFDGTLDKTWVQELAKTFIKNNDLVFIITSRSSNSNINNKDLYNICEKLNIKKHQIFFTDGSDKIGEIIRLNIDIHFENDILEFLELKNDGVNCVLVDSYNIEFL